MDIGPAHPSDLRGEELLGREPRPHAPPPAPADGPPTLLTVRLNGREAQAVERARTEKGMGRAEWVRALIRRQISERRPLSRTERSYMRKALGEIQAMRRELTRMRAGVMQASLMGQDVDAPLQKLIEHERRLTQVVEAIHHGFLGEDSYWARLEDGSDD